MPERKQQETLKLSTTEPLIIRMGGKQEKYTLREYTIGNELKKRGRRSDVIVAQGSDNNILFFSRPCTDRDAAGKALNVCLLTSKQVKALQRIFNSKE